MLVRAGATTAPSGIALVASSLPPIDFHDCNIQLQLPEYHHRSACKDLECRDMGSEFLIQRFDFTPDLIAHVSGDRLAIDQNADR